MTPSTDSQTHAELRHALVRELRERNYIQSEPVAEAMSRTPRHCFVPDASPEEAYTDTVIVTHFEGDQPVSSCSQPAIIGIMLDQLALEPGHRILEIGAGTGYNAALMAELVGPTGSVTTIDVDPVIVSEARERLAAAGYPSVRVILGDGGFGYDPHAPYDRIILTVGTRDIPLAWYRQLRRGGRMVAPLAGRHGAQVSAVLIRTNAGFQSAGLEPCGFISLRGSFGDQDSVTVIGPENRLRVIHGPETEFQPTRVAKWLQDRGTERTIQPELTSRQLQFGLAWWLEAHAPGLYRVRGEGEPVVRGRLPALRRLGAAAAETIGVVAPDGLCLFAPPQGSDASSDAPLVLKTFGPGKSAPDAVEQAMQQWRAAGSPIVDALTISAVPNRFMPDTLPEGLPVPGHFSTFYYAWTAGD